MNGRDSPLEGKIRDPSVGKVKVGQVRAQPQHTEHLYMYVHNRIICSTTIQAETWSIELDPLPCECIVKIVRGRGKWEGVQQMYYILRTDIDQSDFNDSLHG